MGERRVGLIPSVSVALDESSAYALFVTDRRLILVKESSPKEGFKDFLNDMFREVRREGQADEMDLLSASPDVVARMEGSRSVSIPSIRSVKFGSPLGNYHMTVEYENEDGKENVLALGLTPLQELVAANKAQGISAKETKRRYALKCQELIKRIVPPMVGIEARWLE